MKLAGFDHVVIGGAAEDPSFLWIRNENAVIREFPEDIIESWEITDYLRHELGDDRVQILTTGTYGFDGGLNAQIIENYWNSFERYGFGGLMAGKNLRAIAVRGLGDILLANPEKYMKGCLKVLNQTKNSPYYPEAFEKLVHSYSADPGIEEIKHRVDGCFNCPIPCRVFVKYNEPANELSSTDIEEPGMLLTDFEAFAILRKKGLNGEKAARVMEILSRKGIDPGVITSTKTNAFEGLLKEIEEISGIKEHVEGDIFLISRNNIANQIVAYTFGFCPVLSHMAEIVDYELFSQLIMDGADIEVNMVEVEGRINKITP
jgi:aldehyde:ferredoxin oxidoreductase